MAMVAGRKPPASTPYLAQRRDGALSPIIGCSTRHWLDPFVKVKSSLWLKIHGPFRQRASEENGRLNPLRMDITTEAGALFDNHPRHKNKALLLDITIVNPLRRLQSGECSTPRRKTPRRRSRAEGKTSIGARSPLPTPSLPLRYVDMWVTLAQTVHALIKELAIRRVQHRSETYSNDSQHLAEGTEVARLRRRFSFVLQQALSFRTRHHLCRQGVALASTRRPHSQGPASVQAHGTGGITGSEGQEGANGVGGRD